MADVTPLHEKRKKDLKTRDQLKFLQYSRKEHVLHKCIFFLVTFCQNNNVASEKAIVQNNVFWFC